MMMRQAVFRSSRRFFSQQSLKEGVVLNARDGLSSPQAIEKLRSALIEDGFFYVHDVPELSRAYIEGVYDFAEKAHGLPQDIKEKYAASGTYVGPDVGQTELSYDGKSESVARAWEFSRHKFTLATEEISYPEEIKYTETLNELYRRQDIVGEAISTAMANALDISDPHFFVQKTRNSFSTIRLMHYPGYDDESRSTWTSANSNSGDHAWTYHDDDEEIGIAPHTDFELFTVMHWDRSGLELLARDNRTWIKPRTSFIRDSHDEKAPTFLVICGDCLERFTNGLVRATPHRVLQTPHDRMSIIRFHALDPSALVEPLPQFGPPKYTPVTMEKHMRTTMRNISNGLPSWNSETNSSVSASFVYDSPA